MTVFTLSKIISTNSTQDSANGSLNTYLSDSKCSKCLLPAFTYSFKLFLEIGTAVNWSCGILSNIIYNVTFNLETAVGFGRSLMGSRVISVMGFSPANFYLATPFRSRLSVKHRTDRQTDRQTDNGHHCIMPLPCESGTY